MGALTLLLVISLVASSVIVALYQMLMPEREAVSYFTQRYGNMQVATELYRFVTELVVGDVRVALLLLLAVTAAVYLYLKRRISFTASAAVLVFAVVADLWRVSSKPMEPQDQRGLNLQFSAPAYVQYLQRDTSDFRVLELIDGQPPTSNTLAYWRIQSAFGYHGAKVRAYQDVAEVVGLNNPLLWQLMNVKYIITNRPDSSTGLRLVFTGGDRYVYRNETADRRAFFVDTVAVAGALEILQNIRSQRFKADGIAYFTTDPGWTVDRPGPEARATITDYGIQSFSLQVQATGRNLLFVSETYYPEGWIARLDGAEVPIHRADYLFRAVMIPPGEHTLTMSFEPRGFALGKNLSLGTNILVLSGLVLVGIQTARRKKKAGDTDKHQHPTTSSQAS
ncbi:MAG: YfhO family protein [Proteobacteria bacterium]|nr:YfhO family protein [Pseudomonadota bacterium]